MPLFPPLAVIGRWKFVEEQVIAGADVQDVTFSGLLGDTDEEYLLVGRIVKSAATVEYSLEPNNVATAQKSTRIRAGGGGVAEVNANTMQIAKPGADILMYFELELLAHSDHWRMCRINGVHARTGASPNRFTNGSFWEESATEITSLVVHADTAAEIKIGSSFILYSRQAV